MIAYFKFMNFWNKIDKFFCLSKTKLYSGRKPTCYLLEWEHYVDV
jgi:hypothetical protein